MVPSRVAPDPGPTRVRREPMYGRRTLPSIVASRATRRHVGLGVAHVGQPGEALVRNGARGRRAQPTPGGAKSSHRRPFDSRRTGGRRATGVYWRHTRRKWNKAASGSSFETSAARPSIVRTARRPAAALAFRIDHVERQALTPAFSIASRLTQARSSQKGRLDLFWLRSWRCG